MWYNYRNIDKLSVTFLFHYLEIYVCNNYPHILSDLIKHVKNARGSDKGNFEQIRSVLTQGRGEVNYTAPKNVRWLLIFLFCYVVYVIEKLEM